MKWSPLKIYALKLALYTGGLLYLGIDLFVWQGPLWGIMHNENEAKAHDAEPVQIEVYGEKFSKAQVARIAAETEALAGKAPEPALVQQQLITNSLLRMRARYNDSRIPDFMAEATAQVADLVSRARDAEQAEEWFSSQGYTKDSYIRKITSILRQQYYLEHVLKEQTRVTDAEKNSMGEQLAERLVMPERREVKHIFLTTLNKNEAKVKEQAESLLAQVKAEPKQFSELAAKYSDDRRTAACGGNLGMIYVYPPHPLKEMALFGQQAITADEPVLVRSKWGWHLIIAGPIQETRPLLPEEYGESVRSAILSYKKRAAADAWQQVNLQEAEKKKRINIHE